MSPNSECSVQVQLVCRDSGSWSLEYGEFFLEWYSNQLLHHADALLHVAHKIFRDSPVQLQVKLPAIHWWHHTQSHAVRPSLLFTLDRGMQQLIWVDIETTLGRESVCVLSLIHI